MNYIDYVNYLKSKNIILFDHDYRISYHNINKYYNINNNNQLGGGIFLSNKNDDEIITLISLSLSIRPENLFFLTKH